MSAPANRPNFFILLELDPNTPWDEHTIRTRIRDKRQQWALDKGKVGKLQQAAKIALPLVPEIERVMLNYALATDEAERARTVRRELQKDKIEELEREIEILEKADSVTQAQVDDLVKRYHDVLSADQISARVLHLVQASTPRPLTCAARLEPAVAQQIQQDLAFVHEKSLYTLLTHTSKPKDQPDYHESSPLPALAEASTGLYDWTLLQANKTDEVTTKARLAGSAKDIFGSEDKRSRYNETLRWQELDRWVQRYRRTCEATKEISGRQVALFLEKAREQQVDEDAALGELQELARTRSWTLRMPPVSTREEIQKLQPCVICRHANDPARPKCEQCGADLWVVCPDCGEKLAATVMVCTSCGFEIGNRFWVEWVIEEAEHLLAASNHPTQGDYSEAYTQLQSVHRAWSPHNRDDFVTRMDALDATLKPEQERIAKEREEQRKRDEEARQRERDRLEAERTHREDAITVIEASLQARRLYDAQRRLAAAPRATADLPEYAAKLAGFKTTADEGIAKAERLANLAREAHARSDDDEAARRCYEALEVAADCGDAHALLAALPIPAPPSLLAEADGDSTVRLTWKQPSSRVDGYRIRRKVGMAPARYDDGDPVDSPQPQQTTTIDTPNERGAPIYYSIFARIGARYSRPTSAVALLAPPINQLTCDVSPREVRLRWESPSHSMRRVRVRRAKDEPPNDIEQGDEVLGTTQAGVTDREVQTGTRYGYAVFAEYTGASGRSVWSAAATIHAVPQTPPRPIADLRAEKQSNSYGYALAVLNCTRPESGELCIIPYVDEDPPSPGTLQRWDVLTTTSGVVAVKREVLTPRTLPHSHGWNEPGACWYVPVVRLEDMGYVGTAVRFSCVKPVDDLRAEASGAGGCRLRWGWGRKCTRVEIASSALGWPEGTRGVTREIVARPEAAAEGDEGSCGLHPAGATELFVSVTAYARAGDHEIASDGTRLRVALGPPPQLTCEVEKGFLGRGVQALMLKLRGSAIAPALVVVCRQGKPSGDPRDGDLLYQQRSTEWRNRECRIDLKGKASGSDTYVAVFLTDLCEAAAVEVVTPSLKLI